MGFKEEIKKIGGKINFYPDSAKKLLNDWIDSISIDWPISRRRFYATPIPLWKSGDLIVLGKEGNYYEPWKEKPKNNFEVYKNRKKVGLVKDFPSEKWVGEERVFDTWMDSSISELIILKYKTDEDFFKKSYPCSLRPQGKEIIRTWLYYTLLRGYLETGKPCFEDVWINQHILDDKGYKMSKSKGNSIDPQKLLKNYGGEAIRFWAATEGDLAKQDLRCSEERIKAEMKTLNKIWNISKFVMLFEKPKKAKLNETDKLFVDFIDDMTLKIEKDYSDYDFYHPALLLREFIWEVFASHYIEMIKSRAYNSGKNFSKEESESAKYTLHFLLERFLTLIYPIIPKISSIIMREKGFDLLREKWPKAEKIKSNLNLVGELMEFNSEVWKKKKEKGISLRDEIEIKIPKDLEKFKKDLIAMHNIK